jgi:hypothetical protein
MILRLLKIFKTTKISKLLNNSITLSGKACLLELRKKYSEFKYINEAELKVFSQNGEDGIIDYLLNRLFIENAKFVEIGTEDYSEANTRFLYEATNSRGLIIDDSLNMKELSNEIELWKGRILAVKDKVKTKNINSILEKNNFNKNIDLFSIDIDGIDYWIINKLPKKISKIFIAEFNPLFGPNLEITVPNIEDFERTKYHFSNLCWGMSLKALINLMKKKGFIFLGVNNLKNNAFFINEDFKNNFDKIIKNINSNCLNEFTNNEFMESRDKNGNLSLLNKKQQINEIKDCYVINLENSKEDLVKLKDII